MSGEVSVLNTSLMDIPKVGKKTYKHLETLGLKTVKDVLFFFPRSYDDRRQFPLISSVKSNRVFDITRFIFFLFVIFFTILISFACNFVLKPGL